MPKLGHYLNAILKLVFPFRAHLEDEVVYLKARLARADRRIEELEGRFNPVPAERRPPPKLPTLKRAIDWTTYKDMNRQDAETTREQLQAGLSSRSQDTTSPAGN